MIRPPVWEFESQLGCQAQDISPAGPFGRYAPQSRPIMLKMSFVVHDPQATFRVGGSLIALNATPLSVFAFPGQSTDDFFTLIDANGADLFSRSEAQPVPLQLEKSHLIQPGKKLVARHVDLGRELVSVDGKLARVDKQ